MHIKPLDIAITVLAAGLVAVSAIWAYGGSGGEPEAVISGVEGEWIYPLSSDREVQVQGPIGTTVVEIKDKSVRIEESPCPNQTCVAAGAISQPGQWLACLPNQVMVHVEGGKAHAGVDASVY
jgi:Uncharacterized protein conserved in bacteria